MPLEDSYIAGNPRLAGSPFLVVISGCSGSGKSSLLRGLAERGYAVMPEAGRQIVKEQLAVGDDALPWADVRRFADLLASRAMHQFNSAAANGRHCLFDRSLVDVVAHLEFLGMDVPAPLRRAVAVYRYAPRVFITPPWRDIFTADSERRKSFDEAVAEYEALIGTYRSLSYTVIEVPCITVNERVAFVATELGTENARAGT